MKVPTQVLRDMYGSHWCTDYTSCYELWKPPEGSVVYRFEYYPPVLKSVSGRIGFSQSNMETIFDSLDGAIVSAKEEYTQSCHKKRTDISMLLSEPWMRFCNWVYKYTNVYLDSRLIVLLSRIAEFEFGKDIEPHVISLPEEVEISTQPLTIGTQLYRADTSILTFVICTYTIVAGSVFFNKGGRASMIYQCLCDETQKHVYVYGFPSQKNEYELSSGVALTTDLESVRLQLKESASKHIGSIECKIKFDDNEKTNSQRETFVNLFTKYITHKRKSI